MNVNSDSNSVSIKSNELNADQNENEPFEFSKLVDKVMTQKKILSKCCSSLTSDVFDKIIYPKFIIVNPQWVKDKEKVLENSKVIDLKEFALALEQEVGKELKSANQKLQEETVKVETKNKLLKDYILQVRKEFVPIKQYEELKRLYEEAIEKKVKEMEMIPDEDEMVPKGINSHEPNMSIETASGIINPPSLKTHDEFTSSAMSNYKYLTKSADGRAYYDISPDLVPIRICPKCPWFEKVSLLHYPKHFRAKHDATTCYFSKQPTITSQFKQALMAREQYRVLCRLKIRNILTNKKIEANCYNLPEDHLFIMVCSICQWMSINFTYIHHLKRSHKSFVRDKSLDSYFKTVLMQRTEYEAYKKNGR